LQRRALLAGVAAGVALMVPATAAEAATIGISDQNAATFQSPLFPQLKSKYARYVLPYDFRTTPTQLERWNQWYAAAKQQNQRILVSFEHSRKSASAAAKRPSDKAYTAELKAFKKAYPDVKDISVWNEVNRQSRSGGEGQPTAGVKNAKYAARYFNDARKVFTGSSYKIVGLDLLDEDNVGGAVSYLKRFRTELRKVTTATPKYWGIHNYSDTNRGSTTRTKRLIKEIGKKGEIWATETGGIVKLGESFPYSVERANAATGCMFTIAKQNTRIKRLYVYNYLGTPEGGIEPFDAGLVDPNNVPRPAFATVVARKAGPCSAVRKFPPFSG
jgi:hypothetical protein